MLLGLAILKPHNDSVEIPFISKIFREFVDHFPNGVTIPSNKITIAKDIVEAVKRLTFWTAGK